MSKDSVILADPPSIGYIVSIIFIALAGTLGVPFMIWLVFTSIYKHNWVLVAGGLISGLICAGMLQSWKSVRSVMRQRGDSSRHSIMIAGGKLTYRKDDLVKEIPLADILSIRDHLEPSVGGQAWSVRIVYRVAGESQNEVFINAMDFTKAVEKQGKFGALLSEAIHTNQN